MESPFQFSSEVYHSNPSFGPLTRVSTVLGPGDKISKNRALALKSHMVYRRQTFISSLK